jgi:hypothetical protein
MVIGLGTKRQRDANKLLESASKRYCQSSKQAPKIPSASADLIE